MMNYHVQEGWLDHNLTFRTRQIGGVEREYAIGTLTWSTGAKESRKRHKVTLFFEDTNQHLMLTAAKIMKLGEHSHIIVTGTLRNPAEEKQTDGSWVKPADASLNVESITFAPFIGGSGNNKSSDSKAEEKGTANENFAPMYSDALPDGFEEVPVSSNDLPF